MADVTAVSSAPRPRPPSPGTDRRNSQGRQRFSKQMLAQSSHPTNIASSDQNWCRRNNIPRVPSNHFAGAAFNNENQVPQATATTNLLLNSAKIDSANKLTSNFKNKGKAPSLRPDGAPLPPPPPVEVQRVDSQHRSALPPRSESRRFIRGRNSAVRSYPSQAADASTFRRPPASPWCIHLDFEDDSKSRKFHEFAESAVASLVEISARSRVGGGQHLGAALQEVYEIAAAALAGSGSSSRS